MSIEQAYYELQSEVSRICEQTGRDASTVKVMAVSKTVGIPEVQTAVNTGFRLFGENRVEGLEEKQQAFPDQEWHFIGNVQSRKIPRIVAHSDLIHSVYQLKHLVDIQQAARQIGKVQDVLIEVNVSGEESKGGVPVSELPSLIEQAQDLDCVRLKGLMTMAPRGSLVTARACFKQLAELSAAQQGNFDELSMGMSEDWREAVAEGATIIRVGRMIFNEVVTE